MNIREEARKMKLVAPVLAASSNETRNAALRAIADALKANKEKIFAANAEDCRAAGENGIAPAVMKRLAFNEAKLTDVCKGIDQLISLPDPIGKSLLKRELDAGLVLERVSVPIGVIGVIFEARPDALVQISTLCLKSGNCAILKGGKETAGTNRVLFSIIHDAAVSAGLPSECLLQAELHNEIDELLQCEKDVDLLIPRGSNQFVQYIMNNTKIPVMGHADGICHIYLDRDVDMDMATDVILDAKTQYTAACNAVETLLIHREIAPVFLPRLARELKNAGVKLRGTQEAEDLIARSSEAAAQIEAVDIVGALLDHNGAGGVVRGDGDRAVLNAGRGDDLDDLLRHVVERGDPPSRLKLQLLLKNLEFHCKNPPLICQISYFFSFSLSPTAPPGWITANFSF